MTEDFEILAEKALLELSVKLEEVEELEITLSEGVLTLQAPNGDYAINKHLASQQIWYSSPVSKLKYFIYQNGKFVEKKEGVLELEQALLQDLAKV